MPKRAFKHKSEPSKLLSYRLKQSTYQQLQAIAKARGLSPGGLAKEALLERLSQIQEASKGVEALRSEVSTLRKELALATRAIMTVIAVPVTPEQAEEWVRKNLNR
jgi:hypothetical protein